MDYVVRIKLTGEIEGLLEKAVTKKKDLPTISDYFYKPKGTELTKFDPNRVIVRKREFPDRQTICRIWISKAGTGYTDKKEGMETSSLQSYEQWGHFSSSSTEYKTMINDSVKILLEDFPFGRFIKIEAPKEQLLRKMIAYFKAHPKHVVRKNSAVLLAESMKLI